MRNSEPKRVLQLFSWPDQERWQSTTPAARLEWLEFVIKAAWAGAKAITREKVMMTFDDLEKKLQEQTQRLRKEFGVVSLSVFGSVSRAGEPPSSDVDFLVQFAGDATFDRYMNLKLFLEDLLECPIDLTTQEGVRSQIRPFIERDLRRVA